ncbi:MAG TPA: SMC-Scp complex subunit ScpB, partial [Deltaproteobacteria bacterium]|nr:SMC-Scp complex subunit ScpB [Deltaproteobacteria bacterium]
MGKREIVEALVFSASGSLPVKDILKILPETTPGEIEQLVEELNGIYESSERSFRIERASVGYLYVTLEEYAAYLRQLHEPVRLSAAALEVI